MSHVDEGALHAYLDGALDEYPGAEARRIREHLDACPTCVRRLEEERALRAEAHGILGLAAPRVEMPSLEDLRAYVERTGPTPARPAVRTWRLGWVASVVLALGVGWMLRGERMAPAADAGLDPQQELQASVGTDDDGGTAEGSTRLADASGGVEAPPTTDAPGPADATAPADAAVPADAFLERTDLPSSAVATAVAAAAVGDAEGGIAAANGSARPAPDAPGETDVPAPSVTEELEAPEGGTAEIVPELPATEPLVPAELQALAPESRGDTAAAGGASAELSADAITGGERVAESERRRNADPATPLTAQLDQVGRGGVHVLAPGDERFDDEPAQAIPGFEVVGLDNVGDGVEFLGAVVTQRLEGEAVIRIFHLEPEVELSVLPPLDPTLNEVRVQTELGWVVMRGPRSTDELETLLMRLFSN